MLLLLEKDSKWRKTLDGLDVKEMKIQRYVNNSFMQPLRDAVMTGEEPPSGGCLGPFPCPPGEAAALRLHVGPLLA